MKSAISGPRTRRLLFVLLPMMAFGSLGTAPVYANGAGWFLGGMATTRVLGDMRRRTVATETQAAATVQLANENAATHVVVAAPASSASKTSSIESQLNTLDTLLAKGYITKQQYDDRKKAVLDSI
ncbi:MAG: hypothetical protein WBP44_02560 [Gammaproteobacteria bacterium]